MGLRICIYCGDNHALNVPLPGEGGMTFAGVFAIVVGVGMIAQWLASYLSNQIPELKTEPIRIAFHLAAELLTAVLLIVGGAAVLAGASWGRDVYLIALGMLFYTAIVSPGYFAQQGQWAWLGIFGALLVLGIVSGLTI